MAFPSYSIEKLVQGIRSFKSSILNLFDSDTHKCRECGESLSPGYSLVCSDRCASNFWVEIQQREARQTGIKGLYVVCLLPGCTTPCKKSDKYCSPEHEIRHKQELRQNFGGLCIGKCSET